jgi:hypothetical protein
LPAAGAPARTSRRVAADTAAAALVVTGLRALGPSAGAAAALALRRRPRAVVLAGLAVAAEGLVAAYVAGPFASGPVLAGCACRWPPA